ncbi:GntR family transcriptional regulator, partial [Pseudomonas syringae pv. tagetis]
LEGSGNLVSATQLRQLLARISYLRATSVSQEIRRGASNKDMDLMVEAMKRCDPLAAHQASVDQVRIAPRVAREYLKSEQHEDTKV